MNKVYPSLSTEIICSMIEEEKNLTVGDIKGAIIENVPQQLRGSIYFKLIHAALNDVNWVFVGCELYNKQFGYIEGEGI